MARGFGRGVDQLQQLAGYGLMAAGATETGANIVRQQEADLAKTAPYEREFTKTTVAGGDQPVLDWIAYTIGSQGPNLIESLMTAALGAAAGAAVGANPATAGAGAIAGFFAKNEVKAGLANAARKHLAGEALQASEKQLLKSAAAGAAAASLASNYATGVADIYGETVQAGVPDRAAAFLGAVPYAALETLPEFILGARLFTSALNPASELSQEFGRRAVQRLGRAIKGGAGGAALEGLTETGQEALLLAANPTVDFSSQEGVTRLINSFAAGALIGGTLGAAASQFRGQKIASGEPVDLTGGANSETLMLPPPPLQLPAPALQITGPAAPAEAPTAGAVAVTPAQPGQTVPVLPAPQAPAGLLAAPQPITPPDFYVGGQGTAAAPGVAPAPLPAQPFIPPAPEPTRTGVPETQPIPQVVFPPSTPEQRAQAFEAAQAAQPPAAPVNAMTARLAQLRRQMEMEQAQQAAAAQTAAQPTAAETAFTEARAQAAMQQPTVFDPEGGVVGKDQVKNAGRRKTVAGMNTLTAEQQDNVLAEFNNDINEFYKYVQTTPATTARKNLARLAGVDVSVFEGVAAPKPAAPNVVTPAPVTPEPTTPAPLKKGKTNAAPKRKVQQGGKQERANAGRRLAGQGQNRNQPTQEQAGGGEAGGRNRLVQGRTQPQEVKEPAPKKPVAEAETSARETELAKLTDEQEVDAVIVQVNTSEGKSYIENLATLIEWARDPKTGKKAKEAAQTYLDNEVDQTTDEYKRAENIAKAQLKGLSPTNEIADLNDDATFLSELITSLNSGADVLTAGLRTKAALAWSRLKKAGIDPDFGTAKLSDYIVEGSQFFNFGARDPVTDIRQIVAKGGGRYSLNDWNTIDNTADLNGRPIERAVPVGRIKMLVSQFLSALAVKPRVRIYKNQADFKARDPQLYRQAVAARPEGDFDTVNAAGYSFGDGNVIIFSDRIATEAHLRFVLAHETLGHFGLRGILPANQFNKLMEDIYASSSQARHAADTAMDARGMSKAEAVEEYLSDYAAVLDASLVMRVWNAIKSALNKLGVRFGDEAVRYMLDQSRRYVRTGRTSAVFDAASVMRRLQAVESGELGTGRFSIRGDLKDNERASLLITQLGPTFDSFEAAWKQAVAAGINTTNGWDKFKATLLSLANYRARDNAGASRFDELMGEMRDVSMAIKVEFNEALRSVYNRAVAGLGGISEAQSDRLSRALYVGREYASSRVASIADLERGALYTFEDGEFKPNMPLIERLMKQGSITFDMMKNGFDYTVEREDSAGRITMQKRRFDGYKDITENSIEWQGYLKVRQAMTDIELRLLRAKLADAASDRELSYQELSELTVDRKLAKEDRAFLDMVIKTYQDLYTANIRIDERGYPIMDPEAMKRGNDFIASVNAALIGRGSDRNAAVAEFFDTDKRDDVVSQLDAFKKRLKISDDTRFSIQNRVKQIVSADLSNSDAEKYVKRTIATGYIPVIREGAYEMRVEAFNAKTGKRVTLKDSHKEQLAYSQFESESDALDMSREMDKVFQENGESKVYTVQARGDDGQFATTEVIFKTAVGRAVDAVAVAPELNLNEFLRGLRQFDIVLTPGKMENVITALTRQNDSARRRLAFSGTPGFDYRTAIQAVSRHIESRASTIAKTRVRSPLNELMNLNLSKSQTLWRMNNPEVIINLSERVDAAKTDEAKAYARREFEDALYKFKRTNPGAKDWDGTRANVAKAQTGERANRGMEYYNEAARTLAFVDGNRQVDETDFGAGETVSRIRTYTSMLQLGGSIAQGVLNVLSLGTNWLPYMASYNPKTAFGGGFSLGKTTAALHLAMRQVGGRGITSNKFNTAEFYESIAKDKKLQKQYGLTAIEAAFIAQEIREGVMIPAQTNALTGTARGRMTKGWQQKFFDTFMSPFNLSEQLVRRSAGLAAFRLEYDRAIGAGLSEREAVVRAREFAVNSLKLSLGEYSVLNRPPAWRDGIQSFLYMYKVYPTTTIQMFSNLSRNGQLGMLIALWLVAGVSGFPFAEDLEDLIDTLAQMLGFKVGSIRIEMAKKIDEMFPGMSSVFFKGLLNEFMPIPADIASRVSIGDVLPGTGVLLAGANVGQELKDIVGPAPSMILGAMATARDLVTFPFSEKKTLEDVARESPVTLVRMLGDTSAYLNAGAVVDRRGYIVSKEMGAGTVATRLLGFYPQPAAEQYEVIKYANRMVNYQKEVTTGYRQAWIKAKLRGDAETVSEIESAVRDWNDAARGTPLEIRNFVGGSAKALLEASRPAGERALRAAPTAARSEIKKITDLLTD